MKLQLPEALGPKIPGFIRRPRRPVITGVAVFGIIVCGGITMAATGHAPALRQIPGVGHPQTTPDGNKSPAAQATRPAATPTPASTPPAASPSPSPVQTSTPVTINGNVYGAPGLAGEIGGVVAPTSKPLWLSTTNLTLVVGRESGLITVRSPDNLSICYVSGGLPGVGLTPIYPGQSPACGVEQVIFLSQATKPGTYTSHITATTENKVSNGKYIRYDGYIKVTVTSSPSFWLTAGAQQLVYAADGATVQAVKATLTVTRDVGYIGNPQITYATSSSWCASESLDPVGPDVYTWTCQLPDPAGHHMYTLNFYGNDIANQRSAWTGVSY